MRSLALCGKARTADHGLFPIRHRLTARQSCHQRAQADARRAQIRHLIQLDHRIDALMTLQNVLDLLRRDRIQPTAKGAELYQSDVRMLAHELCRVIEPRMIAPLIHDMQSMLLHRQMIDRVLRKDRQMIGLDHFRDAMMDFRIDMVGTSRQKDRMLARLLKTLQDLLAVAAHILAIMLQLLISSLCRRCNLRLCNAFLPQFLGQPRCHALLVADGQKGLQELDMLFLQNIHVAADIFRIGRHNGTIIVIIRCMLRIRHIIRLAGVENLVHALLHQIHDMPMGKLRGIAQGIRRHSRHAFIVEFCTGFSRENHTIAKGREESEPKRIVFVHIERARDPDGAALCLLQGPVVPEHALILIGIDVRHIRRGTRLPPDAALTAVAREILASVRELLHRYEALVSAPIATVGARLHIKIRQFRRRKDGRPAAARFQRKDSRTIGSHESGNIGADDLPMQELFHGAHHSVIVECAALHHNMIAQGSYILELHDLEQRVFDDGKRNACRDVPHLGALFLRLLHLGIHEHRAARAKVYGSLGREGLAGELRRRHVKPLRKVLDKGSAARRACLIECDIANRAILHEEAFHILPANIQHKRDLGTEFLRRPKMCKGFYLSPIRMKRRFHDGLAIAGGIDTRDMCCCRKRLIQLPHFLHNGLQGRALIAAIGCIEQFFLLPDHCDLGCRGTRIDTDVDRASVGRKIPAFYPVPVMPRTECLIVCRILKQREIRLARFRGSRLLRTLHAALQVPDADFPGFLGKRRTHCNKVIAVVHLHHMLVIQL